MQTAKALPVILLLVLGASAQQEDLPTPEQVARFEQLWDATMFMDFQIDGRIADTASNAVDDVDMEIQITTKGTADIFAVTTRTEHLAANTFSVTAQHAATVRLTFNHAGYQEQKHEFGPGPDEQAFPSAKPHIFSAITVVLQSETNEDASLNRVLWPKELGE